MKLIIDVPDEEYKTLSKMSEKEKINELSYYERIIANGTSYNPIGDLISREALKEQFIKAGENYNHECWIEMLFALDTIDNAPTVEAYPFEQVLELVKLNQQFAQEIENLKRVQGELIRLDLAKRVIAKFVGYLDDDMIARIQIALEKENEAEMKGDTE